MKSKLMEMGKMWDPEDMKFESLLHNVPTCAHAGFNILTSPQKKNVCLCIYTLRSLTWTILTSILLVLEMIHFSPAVLMLPDYKSVKKALRAFEIRYE